MGGGQGVAAIFERLFVIARPLVLLVIASEARRSMAS